MVHVSCITVSNFFSAGDYAAMETYCLTLGLDEPDCSNYQATGQGSPLISAFRNSTTNGHVFRYNVTADSTGRMLVPDPAGFLERLPDGFDSRVRPWYTQGKACGHQSISANSSVPVFNLVNQSVYGNFCAAEIFLDATGSSLLLSFVQPFYSSGDVFRGVLATHLSLPDVHLQAYIERFVSTKESEIAIVQDKGMLLLAGLLDSLYHLHLVVKAR